MKPTPIPAKIKLLCAGEGRESDCGGGRKCNQEERRRQSERYGAAGRNPPRCRPARSQRSDPVAVHGKSVRIFSNLIRGAETGYSDRQEVAVSSPVAQGAASWRSSESAPPACIRQCRVSTDAIKRLCRSKTRRQGDQPSTVADRDSPVAMIDSLPPSVGHRHTRPGCRFRRLAAASLKGPADEPAQPLAERFDQHDEPLRNAKLDAPENQECGSGSRADR